MVVNNYAQYCSVVKTGIGKAKMIIAGEVDARKYNDPWNINACSWLLSVGLQALK